MNIPTELRHAHPDVYWLALDDVEGLTNYLRRQQWLTADEAIRTVTKAGEGNMNCTLRVTTNQRSFIIKQARPWVEKYPSIAAPWERALVEAGFYQLIAGDATLQQFMPRLLGSDAISHTNLFEDLGASDDLTWLYANERQLEVSNVEPGQVETLAAYLTQLHRSFLTYGDKPAFANRAMRKLNHFHIFMFPLQSANGIDLDAITPSLQAAAQVLKDDAAYVARVSELGALYLEDGATLLHGDFFPGSWLQAANGLKVIDPEFCFFGAAEFELGVMLAHLHLTAQPIAVIDRLWQSYEPSSANWQPALVEQFAGVEIMRRLIGVAQLPLRADLPCKQELLLRSRRMVTQQ